MDAVDFQTRRMSRYLSEFVGTFALVFTITFQAPGVSTKEDWSEGAPIWGCTSIACVLMVMIYALGSVSGANFNPAVSLALGLCGKMEGGWREVGSYVLVQMVAGLFAALGASLVLVKQVQIGSPHSFAVQYLESDGSPHVWDVNFYTSACVAELLMTAMLCFVVLNVAAAESVKGNQYFGLAIGFTIIAAAHGGGSLSGGCFNPAANFGIDFTTWIFTSDTSEVVHHRPSYGLWWGPLYCIVNCLGAALAVVLFRQVRPDAAEVPAELGRAPGAGRYTRSNKLIAEFIGTFFLVLTAGLNVLGRSMAPVWSIAAALLVMVFSLGSVSGAHFNPSVTFSVWLSGRGQIAGIDAMLYIFVQLLAGVCAAILYAGMEMSSFPLNPGPGFQWAHVAFAEIIFTAVLCFVVLAVCTASKGKLSEYFGLIIGLCVVAGGISIGPVSGGVLNPALSLGVAASNAMMGTREEYQCYVPNTHPFGPPICGEGQPYYGAFWNFIPYVFFQIIASLVASAMFWISFPDQFGIGYAKA